MAWARSTDPDGASAPRDEALERLRPTDLARLLAIALVAIAALLAVATDWQSPVRVGLTLVFVLFVPGLALTELLAIRDPVQQLALATGASLAIETLVAIALLYAGLFSAVVALAIVFGLTVAALVAAVLRRGWRAPHEAPGMGTCGAPT